MTPGSALGLAGRLADLFRETGKAHHQAFIQTDGRDPDWPLWYAERLHDDVADLLGRSFTKSELVHFLVLADKEHSQRAPETDWPAFYASFFLERYG